MRLQSTVQCNLGLLAEGEQRAADALVHLEAAVQIASRLEDRMAEGLYRVYLGRLLARQQRTAHAVECLRAAGSLLTDSVDQHSLGLLHCSWAEIHEQAGEAHLAAKQLDAARECLKACEAGPASELAKSISHRLALHSGTSS